jgi:hypothetical protein
MRGSTVYATGSKLDDPPFQDHRQPAITPRCALAKGAQGAAFFASALIERARSVKAGAHNHVATPALLSALGVGVSLPIPDGSKARLLDVSPTAELAG